MTPLRRYYRGHSLVAMRDVPAAANRYYHFDHQGTTQCLTDQAGAVTDRFAADAWGVELKRTGTSINRQWYIGNWGYERNAARQLDYVRARWYRAGTSWLSRDALPSTQPYAYANNNPVSGIDATGLRRICLDPEWPCLGRQGWQLGPFRYCPRIFDPDTEWNTVRPGFGEYFKCLGWLEAGYAFCLAQGLWNYLDIIHFWGWSTSPGREWHWPRKIMDRVIDKSGQAHGVCDQLVLGAVNYTEHVLYPPGTCSTGLLYPKESIWYEGENRSAISHTDDKDLGWAIGGHRLWGSAEVGCLCRGAKEHFSMHFTLRLTDQQLGRDVEGHFTYRCHRIGVIRDFVACGRRTREYEWERDKFKQRYPDPCKDGAGL